MTIKSYQFLMDVFLVLWIKTAHVMYIRDFNFKFQGSMIDLYYPL